MSFADDKDLLAKEEERLARALEKKKNPPIFGRTSVTTTPTAKTAVAPAPKATSTAKTSDWKAQDEKKRQEEEKRRQEEEQRRRQQQEEQSRNRDLVQNKGKKKKPKDMHQNYLQEIQRRKKK
jgi:hypothetical protein